MSAHLNCYRCSRAIAHDVSTPKGRTAFSADTTIAAGKAGSYCHATCKSDSSADTAKDIRDTARAHNRATFELIGFTCDGDKVFAPFKASDKVTPKAAPTPEPGRPNLARKIGESSADYVKRIAPDIYATIADVPSAIEAFAVKLVTRNGTEAPATEAPKPSRARPVIIPQAEPATEAPKPAPKPAPVKVATDATDGGTITLPAATIVAILTATYTPAELAAMLASGKRPDIHVTIGDKRAITVFAG